MLAKEVVLPNLRLYRRTWLIAIVPIVLALFTLGTPGTPALTTQPITFNANQATTDLRSIATEFTQRVAGSNADGRSTIWLVDTLHAAGIEANIDGFGATVNGRSVALQNVWAASRGDVPDTILVVANRDSPPLATDGADNNASGTAMLIELARELTAIAHHHTFVFAWTDGDAYGALGAKDFVQRHDMRRVVAVIALRRVAVAGARSLSLDGWSTAAKMAPPWLWTLTARAGRSVGHLPAGLPDSATQLLRLAVPSSSGSQGPFVAAGVPAISIRAVGRTTPPGDTIDTVSPDTMNRVGHTVEAILMSIDDAAGPLPGSGGTIFLTAYRTLPAPAVEVILVALFLPLVLVTADLFAHVRRNRLASSRAWSRWALHFVPWLVVLAIVYLANLFSLLPRSPGGIIPPDSALAQHPRYLRVALLLAVLALAYTYTVAVERRLSRRVPVDKRSTVLTAHVALILIMLLVFLTNSFSLLLVLPAAALWPLARSGRWQRSVLPVYLGFLTIVLAMVYYALRLHLGWPVWWYFFLLFENRTLPVPAALLGAALLATASLLASSLYGPFGEPKPDVERRHDHRRLSRTRVRLGHAGHTTGHSGVGAPSTGAKATKNGGRGSDAKPERAPQGENAGGPPEGGPPAGMLGEREAT